MVPAGAQLPLKRILLSAICSCFVTRFQRLRVDVPLARVALEVLAASHFELGGRLLGGGCLVSSLLRLNELFVEEAYIAGAAVLLRVLVGAAARALGPLLFRLRLLVRIIYEQGLFLHILAIARSLLMNGHYIGGLFSRIARLNVRSRRLNDRARGDADR